MSKSLNKVMLLGNVGQPPEVKTGSGTLRTMVSLATNERVKKGENWEDHTEWHRVVFFGRTAEIVRDYVKKGSKIFVEGRLRTYKYEDEHQVTRWVTNIVATDVTLLDGGDHKQPAPPDDAYGGEF